MLEFSWPFGAEGILANILHYYGAGGVVVEFRVAWLAPEFVASWWVVAKDVALSGDFIKAVEFDGVAVCVVCR